MRRFLFLSFLIVGVAGSSGQDTIHFFAGLSGTNAVPPSDDPSLASGDFTLTGSNFTYSIQSSGIDGITGGPTGGPDAAAALVVPRPAWVGDTGIYGPAPAGQTGPLIDDLGFPGCIIGGGPCDYAGCFLEGSLTLTPQQIADLENGLWYVAVGFIRGQITITNPPRLVSAPQGSLTFEVGLPWVYPVSARMDAGSTLVEALSAEAWGTQPLNYTFVKNGVAVSAGPCFIPTGVSEAGAYQVIVSNGFGSVTSAVFALSVEIYSENPVSINVTAHASPAKAGTVAGDGPYNRGAGVALLATPNPSYKFVNWTIASNVVPRQPFNSIPTLTNLVDVVVGTNPVYASIVQSNETLTAHFAPDIVHIATVSAPPQGGSASGGGSIGFGATATVRASPAAGYSFASWTWNGTVVSQSPIYKFTVLANETLTANFVPNPFYFVAGVYAGLFYDAAIGVTPTNAGALSLTLGAQGAYSGMVRLGAASYHITGQFVLDAGEDTASADSKVTLPGAGILDLALVLNTDPILSDPGAGMLTGTVTCTAPGQTASLWTAPLLARRSHYVPNHPAPGLYNMAILPAGSPGSTGPLGDSYGSATLSASGTVALMLNLADGLSPAISFSSPVAQDGVFPVFASLYSGKGILLGWLNFTNDTAAFPGSTIDLESSALFWTRQPGGGLFYTNGFDASTAPMILIGCAYAPSTARTNRLGWGNGVFGFDRPVGRAASGLFFNPVKNILTAGIPNNIDLLINLNAANGRFTGSFTPEPPGPRIPFNGVLLNGLGRGYGFCLAASHQSEAISLAPVPVPQTPVLRPGTPTPPVEGGGRTGTGPGGE
jgi:hypothetical protein